MTDPDVLDRIHCLEQRFEILDKRIDERSKNLRETFEAVDRRIDGLERKTDQLGYDVTKGP